MRIFSSARVAVVDSDAGRRAALCAAMTEFGLLQLIPVADLEEAKQHAARAPLDLCVVHAADTAANGVPFPQYPFEPSRTPAILIAPLKPGETIRMALVHGYRVVLPAPAMPRIVYRRIGSVLQKVRRANRVKGPELALQTPAPTLQ
jgi:DNA-binding NtrC family response regulator